MQLRSRIREWMLRYVEKNCITLFSERSITKCQQANCLFLVKSNRNLSLIKHSLQKECQLYEVFMPLQKINKHDIYTLVYVNYQLI